MKIYSHYGLNDFIVCLGYRGYMLKEYFSNYFLHMSDVSFDMSSNTMEIHQRHAEDWRVTLVDTGVETATGGRIRRIREYLADENQFALTYGDGVSDVDISALVEFHQKHGKLATVTAVQPAMRFGALEIGENDAVRRFHEKAVEGGGWINGGFFILSPSVCEFIENDDVSWEGPPIEELARQDELRAFRHHRFWYPVDTLRDKNYLESLWSDNAAPWRLWE
jgi:glucose-1-phosphate cytidylyltransferase